MEWFWQAQRTQCRDGCRIWICSVQTAVSLRSNTHAFYTHPRTNICINIFAGFFVVSYSSQPTLYGAHVCVCGNSLSFLEFRHMFRSVYSAILTWAMLNEIWFCYSTLILIKFERVTVKMYFQLIQELFCERKNLFSVPVHRIFHPHINFILQKCSDIQWRLHSDTFKILSPNELKGNSARFARQTHVHSSLD